MSVSGDISATYRGPGRAMERLMARGPREDRALAFVLAFCTIMFIAQLPRLARQAQLSGRDLDMLMGATLMAWLVMAPLLLYGLAALSHLVARLLGGHGDGYGARLALFWSLLASSPLILLYGLVAGFAGPGPALQLAGVLWLAVFGWFWLTCLWRAERFAT